MPFQAWDVEHNNLHHYKLGETNGDPDLVERNADAMIRSAPTPTFFKYMQVLYTQTRSWG